MELSVRITLSLLPPDAIDESYAAHSSMGDDVLIHLLHYSPFASTVPRPEAIQVQDV